MYDTHPKSKRTAESDDDDQELRMSSTTATIKINDGDDGDDDVTLPGFRFHPTDEELVGFYLRRKVENKPFSIELIKQIDIYKYDPWDLPKASNVGDKAWYFFCKRERKYRNSIRPNRVTGFGFWKATGIDRPICSGGSGEGHDCIGLKKSLVYYRGSAGKGTKTEWMMHEFRLPADHDKATTKHLAVKPVTQEAAEVWTLCRIFKRNVSYRKCMPDFKDFPSKRTTIKPADPGSQTCSFDSTEGIENYISFNSVSPLMIHATRSRNDTKPFDTSSTGQLNNVTSSHFATNLASHETSLSASYPSIHGSVELPDFFVKHADWDELSSVVEYRTASPFLL